MHIDYTQEVEQEAIDFILNHEDEFKEMLLDDNDDWRSELDEEFHLDVTDRAYTWTDAAYVLENADYIEDMGDDDLFERVTCAAAFTYGNDVSSEVGEVFDNLMKTVDEKTEKEMYVIEENKQEEDNEDLEEYQVREGVVEIVFKDFIMDNTVQPLETLSEKIWWVKKWLRESREVGMRGGNPVGHSYIDSRCGTGFGQPDQLAYINFDHEVARKVPDISGKYRGDVEKYLKQLEKEEEEI